MNDIWKKSSKRGLLKYPNSTPGPQKYIKTEGTVGQGGREIGVSN